MREIKTEGTLVKLDPHKKHILLLQPDSILWSNIHNIKKLEDGLILPVELDKIKIIEFENEIEIRTLKD